MSDQGIFERSVAKTSLAKRARPPCAQHLETQNFEDVSGEIGPTTSRAASLGSALRGCLRRNWLDHLRSGHL